MRMVVVRGQVQLEGKGGRARFIYFWLLTLNIVLLISDQTTRDASTRDTSFDFDQVPWVSNGGQRSKSSEGRTMKVEEEVENKR